MPTIMKNPDHKTKTAANPVATADMRQEPAMLQFLHLLWRRRFLVAVVSIVPAIAAAALLLVWPEKHSATFVYEHPISESEYNVLVRQFYSLENRDRITGALQEKGLTRCAQELLDCQTEGSLERLLKLTVSPAYPRRLQTTDPATSEKIISFQAQLLSIQVTGRSRQEVEAVAAIVTANFENVLPMYVIRSDLKETTRRFKTLAADIENNRFLLDMDLQREQARLEKLKALEGLGSRSNGQSNRAQADQDKLVLQFSDVENSREFLPLDYQVRAVQSKIVDLEETILGNETKYNYYVGLLDLSDKLLDQVERSIQTNYTAQQFLSFVGEQLLASKDKAQADYLKSYMRKTENLVLASTRAGESPVIYPVPKHVAGTTALVFVVFLMIAAFTAVVREPAGRDRR
ncbi:MAG: hypothetical protein JW955_15715 [Sedimentisphaerales bacterium]|nr:hypothetical protein [Sedimentisphaerales bacterium]